MSADMHVGVAAEPLFSNDCRLSVNRAGHTSSTGGFQGGATAGGTGASTRREILLCICGPKECRSPHSAHHSSWGIRGIRVSTALQRSRWDACSSIGREGLLRVVGVFDHSIAPRGGWVAGAVQLEVAPDLWEGGARSPPRQAQAHP